MKLCILFLSITIQVVAASIDRDIENAAETSDAFEFLHGNDTVLVELDIVIPREEWDFMQKYGLAGQETRPIEKRDLYRAKRKGIANKRWADNTMHYEIHGSFSSSDRRAIQEAVDFYNKHTCLRVLPRTREAKSYVYFQDGGGCSSLVGSYGREQPITLGRGCRRFGTIIHEMGHAAGMHHEQTRPDRDDHVRIYFDNIIRGMEYNFQKYNERVIPNWGIPYDYNSVMHYSDRSFTRNGQLTIVALDPNYQNKMGRRETFSFYDVKMLNVMYQCDSHCPQKKCKGEGFMNKDCQCMCPGKGSGRNPTIPCDEWTSSEECKDEVTTCDRDRRFCSGETSPSWERYMHDNCRKTCSYCRDGDGVRTATWDRIVETVEPECRDRNIRCKKFAREGGCEKNRLYMATSCSKTCGTCGQTQLHKLGECVDLNENCADAAKRGECDVTPDVMEISCSKSCGKCGD